MIKKTRIKIIVVTMTILIAVFVAIGAVTFALMSSRPPRYRNELRPGEIPPQFDTEFTVVIRVVESQITKEWLMWYSIFAGAGLIGLFVITYFLSGWIVKPIKETMEKQKRFVSDASHELKTPISIISANADALAAGNTDNKWLQNIKAQTERMSLLTKDLLVLTKIDEDSAGFTQELNLSEIVTETVLPFESVAFEAGRNLEINITENLMYCGAKEDIVKAVNILVDNAVKYSLDKGDVKVSLTKQGSKAVLEVFNTGIGISESETGKIFDRFYRSDFSRARVNGGNGLGLSILKNLADKRGWKLLVNSDGKSNVTFIIVFN